MFLSRNTQYTQTATRLIITGTTMDLWMSLVLPISHVITFSIGSAICHATSCMPSMFPPFISLLPNRTGVSSTRYSWAVSTFLSGYAWWEPSLVGTLPLPMYPFHSLKRASCWRPLIGVGMPFWIPRIQPMNMCRV